MLMTDRLLRLRILASGIVLLTLTAESALARQSSLPAKSPVVFLNLNVVPMDADRILENQTVIVRGEKIDLVGPSNTAQVPSGAVVIDGRGKYLLPGLADMHSHLPEPSDPTDGYAAYDQIGGPKIVHAGCWSHAERYFSEAAQLNPQDPLLR